jgi:photosystem II stability/assembly factor-like uncharacterized protein
MFHVNAQYSIEMVDSNKITRAENIVLGKISFRGLSVAEDGTVWASGSRGTIARSTDEGNSFTYTQINGYEKSDFRDIQAFDANRAVVMSSGTPAYILVTRDGGLTWRETFSKYDTAYFLDAMDFWNEYNGVVVGDPINGHFVLLRTINGGNTWQEMDTAQTPKSLEGEAIFAASGTSLQSWGADQFGFVTGGSSSRLLMHNKNKWRSRKLKIVQGKNSTGAFTFSNRMTLAVAGGDYMNDTVKQQTLLIEDKLSSVVGLNKMKSVHADKQLKPVPNCLGYCSSMIELQGANPMEGKFLLTGTTGAAIVTGLPATCTKISDQAFNVVAASKDGSRIYFAGPKGKLGRLVKQH